MHLTSDRQSLPGPHQFTGEALHSPIHCRRHWKFRNVSLVCGCGFILFFLSHVWWTQRLRVSWQEPYSRSQARHVKEVVKRGRHTVQEDRKRSASRRPGPWEAEAREEAGRKARWLMLLQERGWALCISGCIQKPWKHLDMMELLQRKSPEWLG